MSKLGRHARRIAFSNYRSSYHTIALPELVMGFVGRRSKVRFKCEEEIKSLVKWQPATRYAIDGTNPLSYLRDISSSDPASMQHRELLPAVELSMTEQELGFLRFIAESVNLDIKLKEPSTNSSLVCEEICTGDDAENEISSENELHPEDETFSEKFVHCLIISAVGKSIGSIEVPESWLLGHNTRRCEFILLSACVQYDASETCQRILKDNPDFPGEPISMGIKHVDGCEHQLEYHVMLIDWKEGPHCLVARRVGDGIAHIHRDDWAEAAPTLKEIVLS